MNSESLSREDEQQAAEQRPYCLLRACPRTADREDQLLATIATLRRELSDTRVDRYVTLAHAVAKMTQALNETADMLDLLWRSLSDEERRRFDKPKE